MTLILPNIIAHRGAPLSAPENTLASLRVAKSLGAAWVEFDVRLTRDKQAIIFHDDDLSRTTNGKGLVAETDFSVISQLDAGSWFDKHFQNEAVPTLDAYLKCAAELELGINVELKGNASQAESLALQVINGLKKCWSKHLPLPLISSAQAACLQAVGSVTDDYPKGFIMHDWMDNWYDTIHELGCVSLHVEHQQLNLNRVKAVKSAEKKLLAYTVNKVKTAERLFDMGVDSLFSDNPELLK